jgi:hypothetical protein
MTRAKGSLPDPIELARLAILLGHNRNALPIDQVRVAFELYIEAVLFCRENAALSFEELVTKFRDGRQVAFEQDQKAQATLWGDTLELDPEKESDSARDYLDERHLHLKTAAAVIEHVRKAQAARPWNMMWGRSDVVEHCATSRNGKTIYLIPRFLLNWILEIHRRNRKGSTRKWRTKSSRRKAVK